ncbi:MAG: tetratricopeptide repeat protein, partial [bacterium]
MAGEELSLGEGYGNGEFFVRNYVLSARWLQAAMKDSDETSKSHRIAEVAYGRLLLLGRGVAMDQTRAQQIISPLADSGDRQAMITLAMMYINGWGVGTDYREAKDLLFRVEGRFDNQSRYPFALTLLGTLYLEGWGVDQDLNRARDFFDQAAAVGEDDGQVKLGEMYLYGIGTEKDMAFAARMFRSAWLKDNPLGMYGLAELYSRGLMPDKPKDFIQAYKMYHRAAVEGLPRAQGEMSAYNFLGVGKKVDLSTAHKWALLGASHGSLRAKTELPLIESAIAKSPAAKPATP